MLSTVLASVWLLWSDQPVNTCSSPDLQLQQAELQQLDSAPQVPPEVQVVAPQAAPIDPAELVLMVEEASAAAPAADTAGTARRAAASEEAVDTEAGLQDEPSQLALMELKV